MPGLQPQHTCRSCGEGLYLFQEVCETCDEHHHWFYVADCLECGQETDYLHGACPGCGTEYSPWRAVEFEALDGDSVAVAKDAVERPMRAGYRRHLGMVKGQWADYRRVLEDGDDVEFHVRVYNRHYEMHLDDVSAIDDPAMHALRYAPRAAAVAGVGAIRGAKTTAERSGKVLDTTLRTPFRLLSDSSEQ
jgi:hypothetical protein